MIASSRFLALRLPSLPPSPVVARHHARASLGGAILLALTVTACGGAVTGDEGTPNTAPSATASSGPAKPITPVSAGTASPHPTPNPPTPPVEAWSMSASGCADFQIYAENVAKTKVLHIGGQRATLGLDRLGASVTVSLTATTPALSVTMLKYSEPPLTEQFCTDVFAPPTTPPTTYYAVAGSVTLTVVGLGREGEFSLSVDTRGLRVRSATGLTDSIPDRSFQSVSLGWFPG
ncbi:MAG: hypothetical protein U0235_07770 [Polyangiaceae bacterium]